MTAFPNLARQFDEDFRKLAAELDAVPEAAESQPSPVAVPPVDVHTARELAVCRQQLEIALARVAALRQELEKRRNARRELAAESVRRNGPASQIPSAEPPSELARNSRPPESPTNVEALKARFQRADELRRQLAETTRQLEQRFLDLQMNGL